MPSHIEKRSLFGYEIRGAFPVRANFRRAYVDEFVGTLPDPSSACVATDSVTWTCLICVRCSYTDSPEVERALVHFARKWAIAGAIFYRQCMGEVSFFPIGLPAHVMLLAELDSKYCENDVEDDRTAFFRAQIQEQLYELKYDGPSLSSTETGADDV